MLFVKRLLTALLLFATIFMVLYVTAMAVGRSHARATAAAEVPANMRTFHHDALVAQQAGVAFEQQHGPVIGLSALGVAAVGAMFLSFGGVLSWCRETSLPPLPPNMRYGDGGDGYRRRR